MATATDWYKLQERFAFAAADFDQAGTSRVPVFSLKGPPRGLNLQPQGTT